MNDRQKIFDATLIIMYLNLTSQNANYLMPHTYLTLDLFTDGFIAPENLFWILSNYLLIKLFLIVKNEYLQYAHD